jgi:hypothetical protein
VAEATGSLVRASKLCCQHLGKSSTAVPREVGLRRAISSLLGCGHGRVDESLSKQRQLSLTHVKVAAPLLLQHKGQGVGAIKQVYYEDPLLLLLLLLLQQRRRGGRGSRGGGRREGKSGRPARSPPRLPLL